MWNNDIEAWIMQIAVESELYFKNKRWAIWETSHIFPHSVYLQFTCTWSNCKWLTKLHGFLYEFLKLKTENVISVFFLQVQNKERENMELQSEMADARKKHEVNIKFHDSISCNIYAVTTYLPSNQYTGGPPLTRIQCTK